MYNDSDEVLYEVTLPRGVCTLRLQQTMEVDDLCAIFDDAWLGSRVWEATTALCDDLCAAAGAAAGSNGVAGGDSSSTTSSLPSLAGRSVLELGSGTGVGGLVAACLGATDVVLTDMASPAGTVNLIKHNIEVNRAAIASAVAEAPSDADTAAVAAPTATPRVRAAALDWSVAPTQEWRDRYEPPGGFDVILCCECIYTGIDSGSEGHVERPVWSALVDTIRALATTPRTTVVVCSKERGLTNLPDNQLHTARASASSAAADGVVVGDSVDDDAGDDGVAGGYASSVPRTRARGSLVRQFREVMQRSHGYRCAVVRQPTPPSEGGGSAAPVVPMGGDAAAAAAAATLRAQTWLLCFRAGGPDAAEHVCAEPESVPAI
jgi:predicted nicotinamide N-methyase